MIKIIGSLDDVFSIKENIFDTYITSNSQNLQKGTMPAGDIVIGKRFVVTLVGEMN